METKAQLNDARIAPRKARMIRGVVVGLPVNEALTQLAFHTTKASGIMYKILKSAIANAENNNELSADNLKVKDVIVNEGIKFKRFQPVSRGMAHPFVKRNSKISITLEEIEPVKRQKTTKKADIKTLTLEEKIAQDSKQQSKEAKPSKDTGKTDGISPKQTDKSKEEQASQKIKMQQQGGDKKKTHRRKSI